MPATGSLLSGQSQPQLPAPVQQEEPHGLVVVLSNPEKDGLKKT